jgi:hypothetical protein
MRTPRKAIDAELEAIDSNLRSMISELGMPFANAWERDTHFARHGAEFGAANAFEYERIADAFLFGVMANDTHECVRPSRVDRIRFNFVVHHFGVACTGPVFIRTFYRVRQTIIANHGDENGYFAYECNRGNL